MEKFLRQIEPIIKSKIRKYRPYIKGAENDDLMQEGYLAALIAANRWKIDMDKAGLMSWTMIHIESKFKELAMKSMDMTYIEDLTFEISQEQVQELYEGCRTPDHHEEFTKEKITRILFRYIPKYKEFLECALDENLAGLSVAKSMNLTKQRISQIKKEIRKSIRLE